MKKTSKKIENLLPPVTRPPLASWKKPGKLKFISKEKGSNESSFRAQKNSRSFKALPPASHSIESDLDKLESLSSRNLKARYDWLEVQKQLIQLDPRKKLELMKYPRRYSVEP
jgi:hypothetical protein